MDTTVIELPSNYWAIVRQVLETSLTAKGAAGAKMLHEIFNAFDVAGVEILEVADDDEEDEPLPIIPAASLGLTGQ
jgi:hypothetical protein